MVAQRNASDSSTFVFKVRSQNCCNVVNDERDVSLYQMRRGDALRPLRRVQGISSPPSARDALRQELARALLSGTGLSCAA